MTAEQLDLDLNENHHCMFDASAADKIQNSFVTAWRAPINGSILLGLAWAYRDCGYEYAAKEAECLWLLEGFIE